MISFICALHRWPTSLRALVWMGAALFLTLMSSVPKEVHSMSTAPNRIITYRCIATGMDIDALCVRFAARLAARFVDHEIQPVTDSQPPSPRHATLEVLRMAPGRLDARLLWRAPEVDWDSPPMGTLSSGAVLPDDKLTRFLDGLIAQIPAP